MATFSINPSVRQYVKADYEARRVKVLSSDLKKEVFEHKCSMFNEHIDFALSDTHVFSPIAPNYPYLKHFEEDFPKVIDHIKVVLLFLQKNDYQGIVVQYIQQISSLLDFMAGIVAPTQMFFLWHYSASKTIYPYIYPPQSIVFTSDKNTYDIEDADSSTEINHELFLATELQLLRIDGWKVSIGSIDMNFLYDLTYTLDKLHFLCLAEAFCDPIIVQKITKQKQFVYPFKVAVEIYSSVGSNHVIFELTKQS
jgi:hypothetical protein